MAAPSPKGHAPQARNNGKTKWQPFSARPSIGTASSIIGRSYRMVVSVAVDSKDCIYVFMGSVDGGIDDNRGLPSSVSKEYVRVECLGRQMGADR